MDIAQSSFPPGSRVRIVGLDEADACHHRSGELVGMIGKVINDLYHSGKAPVGTLAGAIELVNTGEWIYLYAARVVNADSLVGRRYVDLTASEKAALPVGTVLRDTGPVHNDYPIPLCRLMADGRWIFDDGSENENWDGYEVVSFVPVSE